MPPPTPGRRRPSSAPRAPCAAGWVRVDLHSHTMWSGDSTTTPDELEQAVLDSGLDVLCITDHNAIKPARWSSPGGCRAGWSSARNSGPTPGRSSGCSSTSACRPASPRPRLRPGSAPRAGSSTSRIRSIRCAATSTAAVLDELVAAGLVDAIEVLNAKTSLRVAQPAGRGLRRRARVAGRRGERCPRPRRTRRGLRRDARLRWSGDFLAALHRAVVGRPSLGQGPAVGRHGSCPSV